MTLAATVAGFLVVGAACAQYMHAEVPILVAADAIDQSTRSFEGQSRPGALVLVAGIYAAMTVLVFAIAVRRGWFRVEKGVTPPEPTAAIYGLGFFALLLVQFLGTFVAARLLGLSGGPGDLREKALVMLGGYAMQLPLALALGLTFGRVRERTGVLALMGLGTLALAWPVIQTAYLLAATAQRALTEDAPPRLGHETLAEIVRGLPAPWAVMIVLFVVVFAPLIEEIAYRGALQGCLRSLRLKAWAAITITSAVFVVMHLPALATEGLAGSVAQLFVLSVALGLVRERSQSLIPCVVAHAAFNAANIVLAVFLATLAAP